MEIELDDYAQKISGALARSPCELCGITSRRLCNTAKQKAMSNGKNYWITYEIKLDDCDYYLQKISGALARSLC